MPAIIQLPHIRSSREVPPRDRFDLSRQALGDPDQVSTLSVGGATIMEWHTTSDAIWHDENDLPHGAADSLCIYQQLGGACRFDAGDGEEFAIGVGGLALAYSGLPYRATPTAAPGFHLRLVNIPFAQCRTVIAGPNGLAPRVLPQEHGIGALFSSHLKAFVTQAPHLKGATADTVVQALAQLALVARGTASLKHKPEREAVRAARLERVRQFIESNLHRPDLTPGRTAATLGVSLRQLHMLFAPTGTTFTRHVMTRRLERARLMLTFAPHRPVTEIAMACGIESSSVFYRGFRDAFGTSPNEFREKLSAR